MAKAGPRRREGVKRYGNGRIVNADRGERPDKIVAVVLAQPHRRGERDHRAGFAYGRMLLGGVIDDRQYQAAEVFTKRSVRYMTHITGGMPRFPSLAAEMIGTFSGSSPDLDDEQISSIRSAYAELQDALADAGMHYEGNSILMRVCVMDKELTRDEEVGAFRCALNVVANRLRLT